MEQASSQSASTVEHKTNTDNSPLVEVKRTLRAPVERVWQAWSDAKLVQQWWGPREFTCPDARTDFRVGGKYLFGMKNLRGGDIVWGAGTYQEIIPNQKIVYTDQFADPSGNPITPKEAGMPNWEGPGLTFVTVDFESRGDSTIMTLTHEGIPKALHDDCVSCWSSTVDKLQMLVERTH